MLRNSPLEIELTTKCTLGCPACPRNDPNEKKEDWDVGHLDTDIAKSFADSDVNRNHLFIGCYGDPLYHPDFIDIMRYYTNKNKRVIIHTNGSFKTKKWWNELASINWNSKLHELIFSVDGLEDTNHLYRIRANWKSIMVGMRIMGALPLDRRPVLEWKYLVFPYNEHQVAEARELANELGFNKFNPVTSERDVLSYATEDREMYRWPDDKT
jgi:MoaA/NifB/PqqE/SkfB family radical SAM enzyme